MIKINIIAVGKLKEKYLKDACLEYIKRISRYFTLEIIEVQDYVDRGLEEQLKNLEAPQIIQKLKGRIVLLDIEGEQIKSEELASYIEGEATRGFSEITFVIGGSRGVASSIKERADKTISFGKITYPHQLIRVTLLEQIYRAGTIIKRENYHK